jgi:DNA-binding transcriptional LysR family regulator
MHLQDLNVFVMVASERSFSKAAKKLHRTQPAVSQAVHRIEEELGDRLFDRSSRNGALTEAGVLLREHAVRLLRMATEAEAAVRELQQVRRGRVLIGANEAAVHSVLPIVQRFAQAHPNAQVEVRRVPSRQMATELLQRTLDFGVSLPAAGKGPPVDLPRERRTRHAGASGASARCAKARHDRGSRTRGRDCAQRSVSHASALRCDGVMRPSTFRSLCPVWTGSNGRWRWGWAWRCCKALRTH